MELIRKWKEPLFALTGRIISSAGPIMLTLIVLRKLPLHEAGQFFLCLTAITGVSILVPFGTNLLIIREVSSSRVSSLAATQRFLSLASALLLVSLVVSIIFLIAGLLSNSEGEPFAYLSAGVIPMSLLGIVSSSMKARGRAGWGGLWEVGIVATFCSFYVFLTAPKTALEVWFIYAFCAWGALFLSIGQAVILGVIKRPLDWIESPDWRFFYQARYLGLTSLLSYLSQWGGVLLASMMINAEAVAIVNSLYRTLAPLQFAILTIDSYLAPKLARSNKYDLLIHLRRARYVGLALVFPYFVFTVFYSDFFLSVLFGDALSEYRIELILIVTGTLTQVAFGPTGICLNMVGKDKYVFKVLILKVSVSLLGAVAAVPWLGVTGFFLMFSFATIVQSVAQYYILHREILSK